MMKSDAHASEEAKRLRHWDPQQRRELMLRLLTWAEAQQSVPRNSKQSCLARQEALNRSFAQSQ